MNEINTTEENEDISFNDVPFIEEEQPFIKKYKKYFIFVVIFIILLIILIISLYFCLKKNEKDKDPSNNEKKINESIQLEIYSNEDNKEIFLLSKEFNITQNASVNNLLFIDGIKYPFTKSMKLKKGKHFIDILFNPSINNCEDMFKNCKDILSIYFNKTLNCNENMNYMFSGCSSLISANLEKINTTEVKSMKNLFSDCTSLKEINFGNFDTKNVINMEKMFYYCVSLEELNLINFNTSLVHNMNEMFSECNKLKKLNIALFDTFNVEKMYHIFYNCDSLEIIDVSNFIICHLKNDISDLFSDITKNIFQKKLYDTLYYLLNLINNRIN